MFQLHKAVTAKELKARIAELQALINQLRKQLAELEGKEKIWCHDFETNLRYGDSGSEVEALQIALEKEGFKISLEEKKREILWPSYCLSSSKIPGKICQ